MKFGKVDTLGEDGLFLPPDHASTATLLGLERAQEPLCIYVGCAKWNKQELKGFYPRGTKDELSYYASQFNAIELNATFYQMPKREQVALWRDKTPVGFRFFPKISQSISHLKRLNDVQQLVDEYCDHIANFNDKLGMVFLQLNDNFGVKNFDRIERFIEQFPKAIPLAVELRHTEWFNNPEVAGPVSDLFRKHNTANIIVDTAGRRDLLHMRLTSPVAFIRFVGANHALSDRARLDDWAIRLKSWTELGLRHIYFFVHQNIEEESPLLSAYFIDKLNIQLGLRLKRPVVISEIGNTLF